MDRNPRFLRCPGVDLGRGEGRPEPSLPEDWQVPEAGPEGVGF